MKLFNTICVIYVIAASLNWGYLCQRPELWQDERLAKDEFAATVVPIAIAIVWPGYWIGRGALEVTKP